MLGSIYSICGHAHLKPTDPPSPSCLYVP